VDFEDYKAEHPNAKFSDYYVEKLAEVLRDGEAHGALGKDLYRKGELISFEEAGQDEFDKYCKWFDLTPDTKVIDLGCGSLRVGLHFIRWLNSGNYFGMDLTMDFIDMGRPRVNEIIGTEWQAELGTIADKLEQAVDFGADFVFSSNVAYHVHPDECATYFDQLDRAASKPGATLCFDTRIAKEQVRFGDRNWAFPFEFQEEALPNFKLVRTIPAREKMEELLETNEVVRVIFHFERA
jgi:cyclopropane fatty-acyl-phospholipid synthase-like methyltransferase